MTEAEVMTKKFKSVEEAENWYNNYAKVMGFSIRKNAKKLDGDGNVQSRRWFCSREGARLQKWLDMGNRKHEPKSISRCECKATFRIRLIKQNSRYEVAEFV